MKNLLLIALLVFGINTYAQTIDTTKVFTLEKILCKGNDFSEGIGLSNSALILEEPKFHNSRVKIGKHNLDFLSDTKHKDIEVVTTNMLLEYKNNFQEVVYDTLRTKYSSRSVAERLSTDIIGENGIMPTKVIKLDGWYRIVLIHFQKPTFKDFLNWIERRMK